MYHDDCRGTRMVRPASSGQRRREPARRAMISAYPFVGEQCRPKQAHAADQHDQCLAGVERVGERVQVETQATNASLCHERHSQLTYGKHDQHQRPNAECCSQPVLDEIGRASCRERV